MSHSHYSHDATNQSRWEIQELRQRWTGTIAREFALEANSRQRTHHSRPYAFLGPLPIPSVCACWEIHTGRRLVGPRHGVNNHGLAPTPTWPCSDAEMIVSAFPEMPNPLLERRNTLGSSTPSSVGNSAQAQDTLGFARTSQSLGRHYFYQTSLRCEYDPRTHLRATCTHALCTPACMQQVCVMSPWKSRRSSVTAAREEVFRESRHISYRDRHNSARRHRWEESYSR